MKGLPADPQSYLDELHERFRRHEGGKVADYIRELGKADPRCFALALATTEGQLFEAGDREAVFTLQSVSKPFTYGLALDLAGRKAVRGKVGVEPTGEAFNSILELEEEVHRPYNPMVNAGAIAVAGILVNEDPEGAFQRAQRMLEAYAGRPLQLDTSVLKSELASADRNRAIAYLLRHFDVISGDLEQVLTLYFRQCSMRVQVRDLAFMGATLANGGVHPVTGARAVGQEYLRDILALMLTCGMYDSAGRWAYTVGLPAKSGVSGGILAVVPGRMGLAVYSPALDAHGHSVRAMEAFRAWSEDWGLSIFAG
jgi:glutaminase